MYIYIYVIGGWIYIIGMFFCKPGPEYETTRDIYPVLHWLRPPAMFWGQLEPGNRSRTTRWQHNTEHRERDAASGPEYETTRDIYPVMRRAAAVKARVVRHVPCVHFWQLLTVRRGSPSPLFSLLTVLFWLPYCDCPIVTVLFWTDRLIVTVISCSQSLCSGARAPLLSVAGSSAWGRWQARKDQRTWLEPEEGQNTVMTVLQYFRIQSWLSDCVWTRIQSWLSYCVRSIGPSSLPSARG